MKNTIDIVLASASPRRADILRMLGIDFSIITSDAEENIANDLKVSSVEKAMELSRLKSSDVANQLRIINNYSNTLVIGADTIVTLDLDSSSTFEKPKDKADALRMLQLLSGREHYVVTGVTIINLLKDTIHTDYEKTLVYMDDLLDNDIRSYIETGEPMDKAGSYGIQGRGSLLVKGIQGCYFNVVGLPVHLTSKMLRMNGYSFNGRGLV